MKLGGEYADHLAIHDFVDMSKAAYAHVTHRFLLHSMDFGRTLTGMAFPGEATAAIFDCHLADDLKKPATLMNWLDAMRPALLPVRRLGRLSGMSPGEQGMALGERLCLSDSGFFTEVAELLALPDVMATNAEPDVRTFALRHSMGPYVAERCLGAGREITTTDGGLRYIGTRDVAEALILGVLGTIPSYADVARAVDVQDWMFR